MAWQKGGGFREDSSAYALGTGVEFQVAPALAVTPFVNFVRAPASIGSEVDLGVKAACRLNKDGSLTARVRYDAVRHDTDATEYSLGTAYCF